MFYFPELKCVTEIQESASPTCSSMHLDKKGKRFNPCEIYGVLGSMASLNKGKNDALKMLHFKRRLITLHFTFNFSSLCMMHLM